MTTRVQKSAASRLAAVLVPIAFQAIGLHAAAGVDVPIFAPQARLDPTSAGAEAASDFDSHAVTDGAGAWVVVWRCLTSGSGEADILVSRSSDDGASWSAPALLHAALANDSGDDAHPRLATDRAGTWIAVWQSNQPFGSPDTDLDIFVSRSLDQGATWSAPAHLEASAASDSTADMAPYAAADGAGNWVAVWQSNETIPPADTDFDVWTARSTNGGASWSASTRLDPASLWDRRNDTEPMIATDGAAWLAIWGADEALEDFATDQDVLVARSLDAGVTWSAPRLLNPNQELGRRDDLGGRIATDGAGTWVAVWASADSLTNLEHDFDILTARSSNGGLDWTPPAMLNRNAAADSGADFDPQIAAAASGRFVAVWQSSDAFASTGTDFDILYAVSPDGGATWLPPSPLHPELQGDPVGDFDPQIASDGAGRFVTVSYASDPSGGDLDIRISRGREPFGPPERLNANATSDVGTDEELAIASDGAGAWVAVWSSDDPLGGLGVDTDVLFARSSDGGARWTAPAALASNASSDTGSDQVPQLAGDAAGRWVAVWQSSEPGGGLGTDLDVLSARSDDGGAGWTGPVAVNHRATDDSAVDGDPSIATDGSGNWVTLWSSDDSEGGTGADFDIRVARSSNGGASWTDAVALDSAATGDAAMDLRPALASDGTGHWVAVWSSGSGSDFDLRVARSANAGASWSQSALLDAASAANPGVDLEPRVATDGAGTWLVVWKSTKAPGSTGADFDILVSRSLDHGASWSAPQALDPGASSDVESEGAPALSTDAAGHWRAVWETEQSGGVQLSQSSDGGLSWTPPVAIGGSGAGADRGPGIASDRGGAWVVGWTSTRSDGAPVGGEGDVFCARGSGPDADSDGLPDAAELNVRLTNPGDIDTDDDGLTDGDEVIVYTSSPLQGDSDGDTLADADEVFVYGTHPASTDTDSDQILDPVEIFVFATDPLLADSDDDQLDDADELFVHGTDPMASDTDGDDLDDGAELLSWDTDPLDPDSDGDGFPDGFEVANGFDPNDPSSTPAPPIPALPHPGGAVLALLLLASVRGPRHWTPSAARPRPRAQ